MTLDLTEIREDLDSLNSQLADIVEERMELVVEVAEYKDKNDRQIVDKEREEEVKQKFESLFDERDMPEQRGREFADLLISTAIDLEEDILDREIER